MEYIFGGAELLARIEPMWRILNAHHAEMSSHFGDFYRKNTFEQRAKDLTRGEVLVAVARDGDEDIGYCIAQAADGRGEVASIFVLPQYRGYGVGDALIDSAVKWLKENGAQPISLSVTSGNEGVFGFYERHGFYPRMTVLRYVEEKDGGSGDGDN